MSQASPSWRTAFSGLSTRGRSFLAAGGAAAAGAVVLGQRDLLRVAVLLVALPLLCVLLVARARHRLELDRTITPARVPAGQRTTVRLEMANLSRVPTGTLLAEDRVPYVLGSRPRFVVDRLPGGQRAVVTYAARSDVRGRYEIGPLRLRLTDPFGMCEVGRSFTATDTLVVVPRTVALTPLRGGGEWTGSGESTARTAAASGEDDVATREYRHGDDLRRVHWRSTARRGELMVRRDEQPHQMRATVLMDRRKVGHRGEGPASSFEWAVTATASIASHLIIHGYGVRVLHDDVASPWTGADRGEGTGRLLDGLAVVEAGGPHELSEAVTTLARGGGDGLVVAVLGEVDQQDVRAMASLVRQGTRGIAVLLETPAWTPLAPRRQGEVDNARQRSRLVLEAAGWTVVVAGRQESIATVWLRAAQRHTASLSSGRLGTVMSRHQHRDADLSVRTPR